MIAQGAVGENSERKKEHVTGSWKTQDLYYIVPENLAELCSAVIWETEFRNGEIRHFAEVSNPVLKVHPVFLLPLIVK
jgi:hypothetical protein